MAREIDSMGETDKETIQYSYNIYQHASLLDD